MIQRTAIDPAPPGAEAPRTEAARPETPGWALPLATLVGAALLGPALVVPYFEDSALYAAVAARVARGATVYRDVFDHKPPAIYVQELLRILLLGRSDLAHRAFELALLVAGGLAAGATTLRLGSPTTAGQAARLLVLGTSAFCALVSSALWQMPERGQVEMSQAAWLAIGLATVTRAEAVHTAHPRAAARLAFLAGAAWSWAAWLKPQAVLLVALLPLVWFVRFGPAQRASRLAVAALVGAAVPSLGLLAWLTLSGALGAFRSTLFEHLPAYLDAVPPQPLFDRFAAIQRLGDGGRALVALVLGAVGARVLARTSNQSPSLVRPALLAILVPLWALATYASGSHGLGHHLIPLAAALAPFIALGLAVGLERATTATRLRHPAATWALTSMALVLPLNGPWRHDAGDLAQILIGATTLEDVYTRRGAERRYYRWGDEVAAARWVESNLAPNEPFLVLGLAGVTYLHADRPAASRQLVTTFAYMPGYRLAAQMRAELAAAVAERSPAAILVRTNDTFPWFGVPDPSLARLASDPPLRQLLAEHYRPSGTIGESFALYRRCPNGRCAP